MVEVQKDPRSKNAWFDHTSIERYLKGYSTALFEALASVDVASLTKASQAIEASANNGGHVYTIGNGGSSAIADHLCCDWTKGTHQPGTPTIRCHSLSANGALFIAIANDFGFDHSFSKQVEFYGTKNDLLIAISSSGNSENILRAVRTAKEFGMLTIGLSGFGGGRLRDEADLSLHVNAQNYGIVEDAHQAVMHVLAQYIVSHREKR